MVEHSIPFVSESGVCPPSTWVWHDEQLNVHWVFGANWFPTISSRSERLLYRQLREQGTRWVASHGTQTRLIGAIAPVHSTQMTRQCVSAAVAFALSHSQGAHALCLEVPQQGFWLVASSDGRLLSQTDCWLDDASQVEQAVDVLRERHPDLQFAQRCWPKGDAVDIQKSEHPLERLDFLTKEVGSCKFRKITSGQRAWFWIIGAFVVVSSLAVLLVAVQSDHADIDDELIERHTIKAQARLLVHAPQALVALLRSWDDLPVDPDGWLLQRIHCRISHDEADCQARYKRRQLLADNNGLKRHQPAGWIFKADSIDHADLHQTIKLTRRPLQPGGRMNVEQGLIQLQNLSAKAASLALGASRGSGYFVGSTGSEGLEDGQNNPSVKRPVSLQVALRQAGVLTQFTLPMQWQEISLEISQGAHIDERHGYLMLNLKGEWIESF